MSLAFQASKYAVATLCGDVSMVIMSVCCYERDRLRQIDSRTAYRDRSSQLFWPTVPQKRAIAGVLTGVT
jgi:hypothetical protein